MLQLGVILSPYGADSPHGWGTEVAQARGGQGTYLPQPEGYPLLDRFFTTRGEVGFYYDTQIGNGLGDMIPTDAEMAKTYVCYTPVHSGWINTPDGFLPTPWRFGWNPAGPYGPTTSLSGGLGAVEPTMPVQTAADVIAVMSAQNRKMFLLSVISTAAVSISAVISLGLRYRRLKHEMARKRR